MRNKTDICYCVQLLFHCLFGYRSPRTALTAGMPIINSTAVMPSARSQQTDLPASMYIQKCVNSAKFACLTPMQYYRVGSYQQTINFLSAVCLSQLDHVATITLHNDTSNITTSIKFSQWQARLFPQPSHVFLNQQHNQTWP